MVDEVADEGVLPGTVAVCVLATKLADHEGVLPIEERAKMVSPDRWHVGGKARIGEVGLCVNTGAVDMGAIDEARAR